MAHVALYRAFRPQTFDEVVAQKHIVYPLRQSVRNGTVNHALLFSGTRGTGKTSLAKIYAKAINCLDPADGNPCNACSICRGANDGSLIDILEMDAASNNSVDNIRKMTDEVIYTPVSAKYKVYIIDEAHMLSGGAFNALLKTLEEPPAHVVFILATTEAHRIPPTISSRCQRYDFRRIGQADIEAQLNLIAANQNISLDGDAIKTIASLGDGALRDAISLLDQVSGGVEGTITRQHVLDLVGLTSDDHILTLLQAIVEKQPDKLLAAIHELAMSGRDLPRLALDLGSQFRNLLVLKFSDNARSLSHLPASVTSTLQTLAPDVTADHLIRIIEKLSGLLSDLRFSGHPRTTLEIGLLALCAPWSDAAVMSAPAARGETAKRITDKPKSKSQPETLPETKPETKPAAETIEVKPAEIPEAGDAQPPVLPEDKSAGVNHLDLLEVWDKVLGDLSANQRMDLRLMAKPADVALADRVFTIRVKDGMQGAYQLLSKRDSVELLTSLVVKHLGRPVSIQIAIGNGNSQATAEEEWLRSLRERT